MRARAGAGAVRVAGEAGERDEAAHAAVGALGPPVEAVKCERGPAPERRGLQERPERPMKLPTRTCSARPRPPRRRAPAASCSVTERCGKAGGKGKEKSSEPKGKAATATHPLATGGEKNRGLSSFLLEIFPFLVPFQNNVYSRDSPCTTRPQQGGTVHGHTDKTELLL